MWACGILAAVGLLGLASAWIDYETNWVARRLGRFLVRTNHWRTETGDVWQRLEARSHALETLSTRDAEALREMADGLPGPVQQRRFQIERIPETGPPGYVGIWKTRLANADPDVRALGEVITSLRVYAQGRAVMANLALPDVHFHAQVQAQVAGWYTQLGELDLQADTLIAADGDTLHTLDPDSLRSAVFGELAVEIIPELKKKAEENLMRDYEAGRIGQIFLHRDLGRYRGELYREGAEQMPIHFKLGSEIVLQMLDISMNSEQ